MLILLKQMLCFFFFKQMTAYEMRISDWSSDVCSSDLRGEYALAEAAKGQAVGRDHHAHVAPAHHRPFAGHAEQRGESLGCNISATRAKIRYRQYRHRRFLDCLVIRRMRVTGVGDILCRCPEFHRR